MAKSKLSMAKSTPETIRLLVIIVNYFSASLVAKLVEQLANQTLPSKVSISIICADNSCSPEQKNELGYLPTNSSLDVELIENSYNLGFGEAINRAIDGKQFDFLCCINPDVSLLPNCLFELLSHCHEHPTEGIWGGLTVDDQDQPDFRHAWQEPTLRNTLGWALGLHRLTKKTEWQDGYQHFNQHTQLPYAADSVSGCFFMISAPAWHAVDGFDTEFFLYSEEIDLCRRARFLGFQPTVVPQSKLRHAAHSAEESIHRIQTVYLSKFLYIGKHHGRLYNFFYRCIIFVGSMIRAMISMLRGRLKLSSVWSTVALSSIVSRRSTNLPDVDK